MRCLWHFNKRLRRRIWQSNSGGDCLKDNYHNESSPNAYGDIRKFMEANDFVWKQGSVYFGTEKIDVVKCILAVQKLARTYPWFATCVKDVRMLRIEENNDLLPAIS